MSNGRLRCVVADAGPLHYLVLIGQIDLLPQLFELVLMPQTVGDGLTRAHAAVGPCMDHPPVGMASDRTHAGDPRRPAGGGTR